MEKEEVELEKIGSEDAENGASLADADQKGHYWINLDTNETYSGSMFGSS